MHFRNKLVDGKLGLVDSDSHPEGVSFLNEQALFSNLQLTRDSVNILIGFDANIAT